MANYNLKFGLLAKKTGNVSNKEVFNSEGKQIGSYSGEIKNGVFNGNGLLIVTKGYDKDDLSYEGEFNEGKFHGKGILTDNRCADYIKFQGEFKNNEFHGKGTIYYENGEVNVGDFENDKLVFGKRSFNNNKRFKEYEGEYKVMPFGKGKITYVDGSIYKGGISNKSFLCRDTWRGEVPDSSGCYSFEGYDCIMTYSNGDIYDGCFVDDAKQKFGIYKWADGSQYKGNWKGDKRAGSGIMVYLDGTRYEGEWLDGKRHGNGTLFDANDFVLKKGNWSDDVFEEDTRSNKISLD
jgi:hypothetical protein